MKENQIKIGMNLNFENLMLLKYIFKFKICEKSQSNKVFGNWLDL